MKDSSLQKLSIGTVAAWFAFSLSGSALHLFRNTGDRPAIPIVLANAIPIVVFLAAYFGWGRFRQFVLSLNPAHLTMTHVWRLIGIDFLLLASGGILPRFFAWPAGWGDIFIGATAIWVGRRLANPDHRRLFIAWQLLGVLDLVTAITTGALARLVTPNQGSMLSMTVLPHSLIPTFLVPLFMIFHLIAIFQAVRWPSKSTPVAGSRLASSAI